MENMYYIGLDVHKKTISYWVKDGKSSPRTALFRLAFIRSWDWNRTSFKEVCAPYFSVSLKAWICPIEIYTKQGKQLICVSQGCRTAHTIAEQHGIYLVKRLQ